MSYTPSTDELRAAWVGYRGAVIAQTSEPMESAGVRLAQADRAIASIRADAAREALEQAADHLDHAGIVWHGDGGVSVSEWPYEVTSRLPLVQWLRGRAPAL